MKRLIFKWNKLITMLLGISTFMQVQAQTGKKTDRLNILAIMADYIGWFNTSYYNMCF